MKKCIENKIRKIKRKITMLFYFRMKNSQKIVIHTDTIK